MRPLDKTAVQEHVEEIGNSTPGKNNPILISSNEAIKNHVKKEDKHVYLLSKQNTDVKPISPSNAPISNSVDKVGSNTGHKYLLRPAQLNHTKKKSLSGTGLSKSDKQTAKDISTKGSPKGKEVSKGVSHTKEM